MSKIFYDHIIRFERLEVHINQLSESNEEKHELWNIVDKIIHNRIISAILHKLPHEHHEEFSEHLKERPQDKKIIKFLSEASGEDMQEHIKQEFDKLEQELLKEIFDE